MSSGEALMFAVSSGAALVLFGVQRGGIIRMLLLLLLCCILVRLLICSFDGDAQSLVVDVVDLLYWLSAIAIEHIMSFTK